MRCLILDAREVLKAITIDKIIEKDLPEAAELPDKGSGDSSSLLKENETTGKRKKEKADLTECIYHSVVNTKGLIKDRSELQLPDEVDGRKGLNECYDCDGHKQNCPDYKSIRDLQADYHK